MDREMRYNASGYNDPTANEAIKHIDMENKESDTRFYKLLHTIFHVCELAGFEVKGRIEMRDKVTGKMYR